MSLDCNPSFPDCLLQRSDFTHQLQRETLAFHHIQREILEITLFPIPESKPHTKSPRFLSPSLVRKNATRMWSRFLSSSCKRSFRFAQRNAPLRTAQRRFYSNTTSQTAWNSGVLLGAGALGLTCAYLTKKAFALNSDPVPVLRGFFSRNRTTLNGRRPRRVTCSTENRCSITTRSSCALLLFLVTRSIFSGSGNRPLAESICQYLGVELQPATVGRFNDNEINIQINKNVRGRKIFIVQSTCPPVLPVAPRHS